MMRKPDNAGEKLSRSTLCFGGSFNPIHHGHLICARAVAEAGGYQHVMLIPTGQPPHKPVSSDLASAADRLEMCRLGTADAPLFSISTSELERTGPSYTIDTVRQLAAADSGRVDWLIGADMLLYLPKWHRAAELLHEVHFVVMARPGWKMDWDTLPIAFRALRKNVIEAPMIDICATDVRQRVAEGLSIRYLTPPAVCEYVSSRGIYR
jgi:nicotinate-nucleotide adenylyltransferase